MPEGLLPTVTLSLARAARTVTGRVVRHERGWTPLGDPMEVALHVLALRCGLDPEADEATRQRSDAASPSTCAGAPW